MGVDALGNLEHAVERRLETACEFRHHHVGEAAVAPKDSRRAFLDVRLDDLAQFNNRLASGKRVGGHRRRRQRLGPGKIPLRQFDSDLDRIAVFAAVGIADRYAAEQRLDGVIDVTLLDAKKLEPVLVDRKPQPRPPFADRIVDIDDERHFGENLLELAGDRPARCRIGSIDFSQQRRKHRWPGRHLDDLDAGAGGNI